MQLLIPIILIGIAGGLFTTVIDPEYAKVKLALEEKAKYDETLEKTKEVRELRTKIQNTYNAIDEDDRERLKKMLPSHIDNIRLILDVNNVAEERGLTIRNIKIDSSGVASGKGKEEIRISNEGTYESVGFSFSVVTSYENFKLLLADLSRSLRLIDVNSVSISPITSAPGQEFSEFYQFNVGIKTYWAQ